MCVQVGKKKKGWAILRPREWEIEKREREIERERQTDRQTDTDTQTHRKGEFKKFETRGS